MPVVAFFYGMIIRMYHADHRPPHFHVQYGEMTAVVELATGRVLHGRLPPRLRRLLNEWRRLRTKQLQRAWRDTQQLKAPKRIKPLE